MPIEDAWVRLDSLEQSETFERTDDEEPNVWIVARADGVLPPQPGFIPVLDFLYGGFTFLDPAEMVISKAFKAVPV